MKYVRLIRKDENAVSPVIATILMVAITVVLAAVLYVMVSGLLTGPGTGPRAMGVNIATTGDGKNWTVTIQTTPSGENPDTTFVLIRNDQGVITLARTSWSTLSAANWNTYHVLFQDANPGANSVALAPGDGLIIAKASQPAPLYPAGSTLEISDGAGVLTSRALTG